MEVPCYNPSEKDMHNRLGLECDGVTHKNAPPTPVVDDFLKEDVDFPPYEKPWWQDGDKVGAMAATIVLLGVSLIILALCLKFVVWLLT